MQVREQIRNSSYRTKMSAVSTLSVVDSSTKLVHVFPLKRGGRLTIKEFVSAIEETLTGLAQEGTCIRVLCGSVGGEGCINICDRQRTVQYYLLDAKPWYIRTGVFSAKQADVHIKEANKEPELGNEATIKMDLDRNYVRDLKQKFAMMTCSLISNLHLVFEKRKLENDKRLCDCNLTNGCVVPCVSVNSSAINRKAFGPQYVQVSSSNTDHLQLQENGGHSPAWRRVAPGMWLEGKCGNDICVAYSRLVVMNQGFTDLDFVRDGVKHGCKCPMCYANIAPTACGFSRCEWMTVGLKKTSEQQHPQVVRQDWQRLEEGHCRFTPNKDTWLTFKVATRELISVKFCVLCMTSSVSKMAAAPCGHVFHLHCAKEGLECLQCIGEQNMTTYQNCF